MAKVENIKSLLREKAMGLEKVPDGKSAVPCLSEQEREKPIVNGTDPTASNVNENQCENMLHGLVAKMLVPEMDYGVIPNCKKPSLFKAGAEKLCQHFGFRTSLEVFGRIENFDKNFVAYMVKVTVKDPDGNIHAEGIGEANSQEKKFLKGDFPSSVNTVLKIAKKRAYVDAILTATHTSGIFTQDMEDIAAEKAG